LPGSKEDGRLKILAIGAVYPIPFSGAGYLLQLLIGSHFGKYFNLTHINTLFATSVADLEKVKFKKLILFFKYLWLIFSCLVSKDPDYVILNPAFNTSAFLKDSIYHVMCACLMKRKVIWWGHAWGFKRLYDQSGFIMRGYIRWIAHSVYRVVTPGYRQYQDFDFVIPVSRIYTIYHGLPAEPFCNNRDKRNGIVRVLYLSNLIKAKGWRIMLEAAQQVCSQCANLLFDFYGNSAENSQAEIAAIFAATGYPERIFYHGSAYGSDKKNAFELADIFCFPTYFPVETLGVVNLEAMNAGLPIITTVHANIPEIVIDGQGGILIAKEDAMALTQAILRLAEDKEARYSMGKYNQKRFYELFTVDRFVERWIEFICDLGRRNS
jgi:glycosyltransferase involved in cell wall biosynthesis